MLAIMMKNRMKKVASSSKKIYAQFKTRVQKILKIKMAKTRSPFGLLLKLIPFGVAHTYIGHRKEYPPPRSTGGYTKY